MPAFHSKRIHGVKMYEHSTIENLARNFLEHGLSDTLRQHLIILIFGIIA